MCKVGFIGTGIMGKHIAYNLLKAGVDLAVFDANQSATDVLVKEGAAYRPIKELAETSEVIFTMLPNGDIVKQVLLGEQGAGEYAKPGTIFNDLSSIRPDEAGYIGQGLSAKGMYFLDSPVSGGEAKAQAGTLALMVGGDQEAFNRMKPLYDVIGASAVRIGGVGTGSVTKLTNQIIVNLNLIAISEGFVLAAKAGADPTKVYEAIRGGAAGSTIMDMKFPLMVERSFGPSAKISINHKDIGNVMSTAHSLNVPLPFTSLMFETMQCLMNEGQADEDHASIVKFFERLAGVEV